MARVVDARPMMHERAVVHPSHSKRVGGGIHAVHVVETRRTHHQLGVAIHPSNHKPGRNQRVQGEGQQRQRP